MDKKIYDFLESQSVFSFCTSLDNEPYCASCMYAFYPENHALVFASEKNTKHITNALLNNRIAGTVLPFKMEVGMIRGIQFTGSFCDPTDHLLEKAKYLYYKKYPFALVMKGQVWLVQLETVKMTDNTLGFGKKIYWELNA